MIKAGEGVICSTQSANRDAAVFTDPDKFDIHRQPNADLGFGYGVHECIAADLSRAELQIALGKYCAITTNLHAVPCSKTCSNPSTCCDVNMLYYLL
jgi:cytochrome P450